MGRFTLEAALEAALASGFAARLATLAAVSASHVALSALAFRASARAPPGSARAALLLPIAAALFVLPVLALDGSVDPLLAQGMCCLMSMSAFKVIALCAGRGTLADPDLRCSPGSWLVVCLLPVVHIPGKLVTGWRRRFAAACQSLGWAKANLAIFVLLATFSTLGIRAAENRLRELAVAASAAAGDGANADVATAGPAVVLALHLIRAVWYFGLGVALMCEVNGMGQLVDTAAMLLAGLRVELHFDRVWLATSFAELWGRRWNLTVTQVLRPACYDPFIEGHWVVDASPPAVTKPSSPRAAPDSHLLSPLGPNADGPYKPDAVLCDTPEQPVAPDQMRVEPREDDASDASSTFQFRAPVRAGGADFAAADAAAESEDVAASDDGSGGSAAAVAGDSPRRRLPNIPDGLRRGNDPWVGSGSGSSSAATNASRSPVALPYRFAVAPSPDDSSHSGSSSRTTSRTSSNISGTSARISERSVSCGEDAATATAAAATATATATAKGGDYASYLFKAVRRRRVAAAAATPHVATVTATTLPVNSSWALAGRPAAVPPPPRELALKQQQAVLAPPQPQQQPQQRGSRPGRPSRARRFAGTQTTFLVSGLWHELVFFSMCGSTSGGSWLLLFTMQAPIMMLEAQLKKAARRRGRKLPPLVARVLVHLTFFIQLMLLWYPPMVRSGMMASLTHTGDSVAAAAMTAVSAARWGAATALAAAGFKEPGL
ncbi:hypothetical protein PLESTF_000450000 [Pleodorina starrii]|nr:hypothetical protein PLESTF_000450000 [Pleodorina starrii]